MHPPVQTVELTAAATRWPSCLAPRPFTQALSSIAGTLPDLHKRLAVIQLVHAYDPATVTLYEKFARVAGAPFTEWKTDKDAAKCLRKAVTQIAEDNARRDAKRVRFNGHGDQGDAPGSSHQQGGYMGNNFQSNYRGNGGGYRGGGGAFRPAPPPPPMQFHSNGPRSIN